MTLITRSTRRRYPGAIMEIWDPKVFECPCYLTVQLLARRLQLHGDPWRHATIIGGKIYTDAPYWEIFGVCRECIP